MMHVNANAAAIAHASTPHSSFEAVKADTSTKMQVADMRNGTAMGAIKTIRRFVQDARRARSHATRKVKKQ